MLRVNKPINLTILHCISSYPTPDEETNLLVVRKYMETFGHNCNVGLSFHGTNPDIPLHSFALGGSMVEIHFTLDKTMKGNDHKCSFDPDDLTYLTGKLGTLETVMGTDVKSMQPSETACYDKLGKAWVFCRDMKEGETVDMDNVMYKISTKKNDFKDREIMAVIGKRLPNSIKSDQPVLSANLS